ncbi:hypothetical protein [Agrobacterium pusense]|uniref:hypothetical protein n=1 Tax=Agrobacterium pusense TaxID=648995 RepID=UPI0022B8B5E5|nr:hypothetical protein [Agrobacterium pusense]MCZ7926172.1 hypothetical protein [Agrobacterium pusense]
MFSNKAQEKHDTFIEDVKSKFREHIKKCKTIDEVDILENSFNELGIGRLDSLYMGESAPALNQRALIRFSQPLPKSWIHENNDREYASGFVIKELKDRIVELEKAVEQLKTGERLYHRVA